MRCVKICVVVRILLLHPGKSRAVNKNKVQVKPKNHSKDRQVEHTTTIVRILLLHPGEESVVGVIQRT